MSFIYSEYWWSTSGVVLVPLVITSLICVVLNRKEISSNFLFFTLISFIFTFLSGRWEVTEESNSLFLIPFFLIFLAFFSYFENDTKILIKKAPLAFSGCFLSLFLADLTHAILYFPVLTDPFYLKGIAGAGLQDGIFIFFFVSFFLVHYAVARKNQLYKKTLA